MLHEYQNVRGRFFRRALLGTGKSNVSKLNRRTQCYTRNAPIEFQRVTLPRSRAAASSRRKNPFLNIHVHSSFYRTTATSHPPLHSQSPFAHTRRLALAPPARLGIADLARLSEADCGSRLTWSPGGHSVSDGFMRQREDPKEINRFFWAPVMCEENGFTTYMGFRPT